MNLLGTLCNSAWDTFVSSGMHTFDEFFIIRFKLTSKQVSKHASINRKGHGSGLSVVLYLKFSFRHIINVNNLENGWDRRGSCILFHFPHLSKIWTNIRYATNLVVKCMIYMLTKMAGSMWRYCDQKLQI